MLLSTLIFTICVRRWFYYLVVKKLRFNFLFITWYSRNLGWWWWWLRHLCEVSFPASMVVAAVAISREQMRLKGESEVGLFCTHTVGTCGLKLNQVEATICLDPNHGICHSHRLGIVKVKAIKPPTPLIRARIYTRNTCAPVLLLEHFWNNNRGKKTN